MDIWAISGNNTIEVGNNTIEVGNNKKKSATHYTPTNSNQEITTVQVRKYNVNKLSLHLHTSIYNT